MSYRSANLNKYTTSNGLYRWHIDSFHRHLVDLARQSNPLRILDAGCGEGHLTVELRKAFPEIRIDSIDFSEGAIDYAKNTFGDTANFSTGDVHHLDFDDNQFDLVVCSQVLEHLPKPEIAVQELKRVSKKHVLISVPLEPYFKFFNDISRALGISPDPEHLQFWNRKTFPAFVEPHFSDAKFSTLHYYQTALANV